MRTEQEYRDLEVRYNAQIALNKELQKLLEKKELRLQLAENDKRNLNYVVNVIKEEFQSLKEFYQQSLEGERTERMS